MKERSALEIEEEDFYKDFYDRQENEKIKFPEGVYVFGPNWGCLHNPSMRSQTQVG